MSIKEKDSAAEQPSEVDWRQYHSALCKCAELLPNMREGDSIFDTPRFLAEKIDRLAHLARQSPAPEKERPIGYARQSELDKLADDRIAGVGMMIHKDAGEGKTAIYLAPVAQEVEPGSAPAAAEEVRDAALEEAALQCEIIGTDWLEADDQHKNFAADYLARAIRALKTTASAATSEEGGA